MNKHARKIWHAWVDSKAVQYWDKRQWENANPAEFPSSKQPQTKPNLWRIKPKRKPIRMDFRVAIMQDLDDPDRLFLLAPKTEDLEYVQSLETFVAWGTTVLSTDVVVEVEE